MSLNKSDQIDLDSYFDKIFYINLKKDLLRNEQILAQFSKFNIQNFERIEAIELSELPTQNTYRNFIRKNRKYLLGGLSCRASHIHCMKLALQRNYKRILILEDDIIFLTDPNNLLLQNKEVLRNWDILYFGGLIEPEFRNQVVCAHAYGVNHSLFEEIINMAEPSGMEIDNFYAKIIQHMCYNSNQSGRYNIGLISPFNMVIQNKSHISNIQ